MCGVKSLFFPVPHRQVADHRRGDGGGQHGGGGLVDGGDQVHGLDVTKSSPADEKVQPDGKYVKDDGRRQPQLEDVHGKRANILDSFSHSNNASFPAFDTILAGFAPLLNAQILETAAASNDYLSCKYMSILKIKEIYDIILLKFIKFYKNRKTIVESCRFLRPVSLE